MLDHPNPLIHDPHFNKQCYFIVKNFNPTVSFIRNGDKSMGSKDYWSNRLEWVIGSPISPAFAEVRMGRNTQIHPHII